MCSISRGFSSAAEMMSLWGICRVRASRQPADMMRWSYSMSRASPPLYLMLLCAQQFFGVSSRVMGDEGEVRHP
jgi:hypothetical protein